MSARAKSRQAGYRADRMAFDGIRQDVAHGNQPDGEEQLPAAAAGA